MKIDMWCILARPIRSSRVLHLTVGQQFGYVGNIGSSAGPDQANSNQTVNTLTFAFLLASTF